MANKNRDIQISRRPGPFLMCGDFEFINSIFTLLRHFMIKFKHFWHLRRVKLHSVESFTLIGWIMVNDGIYRPLQVNTVGWEHHSRAWTIFDVDREWAFFLQQEDTSQLVTWFFSYRYLTHFVVFLNDVDNHIWWTI